MTNRYAFLSTEKRCQTAWSGHVFVTPPAKDLKSALVSDILCRQNGMPTETGTAPLLALGILCAAPASYGANAGLAGNQCEGCADGTHDGPVCDEPMDDKPAGDGPDAEPVYDGPVCEEAVRAAGLYGADAWRLAQILEKDTSRLAPYWRLIQKWFHEWADALPTPEPAVQNVITKELQSLPETVALARAVQNQDVYHTLTCARSLLKHPTVSKGFVAAVLAPFVPHLLFAYLPEAPRVYTALRAFTGQAIALQVNGRFAGMMPVIDKDFDRIRKEALKSPLIQRKIGAKHVQNCIYVPGKVFNVIC